MNTCFSSLVLLSALMELNRFVHSSWVVMIMLLLHWRRLRRRCHNAAAGRRQALPTLSLASGLQFAMHSSLETRRSPRRRQRAAPSWQLLAPDARLRAPAWIDQPRSEAALSRHAVCNAV